MRRYYLGLLKSKNTNTSRKMKKGIWQYYLDFGSPRVTKAIRKMKIRNSAQIAPET